MAGVKRNASITGPELNLVHFTPKKRRTSFASKSSTAGLGGFFSWASKGWGNVMGNSTRQRSISGSPVPSESSIGGSTNGNARPRTLEEYTNGDMDVKGKGEGDVGEYRSSNHVPSNRSQKRPVPQHASRTGTGGGRSTSGRSAVAGPSRSTMDTIDMTSDSPFPEASSSSRAVSPGTPTRLEDKLGGSLLSHHISYDDSGRPKARTRARKHALASSRGTTSPFTSSPIKSTSSPHIVPTSNAALSNRPNVKSTGYTRQYVWMKSTTSTSTLPSPSSTSFGPTPRKHGRPRSFRYTPSMSQLRHERQSGPKLLEMLAKSQTDKQRSGLLFKAADKWRRSRHRKELEHEERVRSGEDSLEALRNQVKSASKDIPISHGTTFDQAIHRRNNVKVFDPQNAQKRVQEAKKRLIPPARNPEVDDLINKLNLEDRERDKKIADRYRLRVPRNLTAEQTEVVESALSNRGFKSKHGREVVEAGSLARLRPSTWLDDEVINFYGSMIQSRADNDAEDGKPVTKLHYFNTFFYKKMSEDGYTKMLSRWTKKVDIFQKDLVIFPINVGGVHWTCGAIDFKRKRLEYYDSLGNFNATMEQFFEVMKEYLDAEHKDKKQKPFDFTGWGNAWNDDSPQQNNGSDCGVFSCQTIEARARGKDLIAGEFEFEANNMPYLRKLMIWEIAQTKLAERW